MTSNIEIETNSNPGEAASKSWTARYPVKIICVILIPVLVFISTLGIIGLAKLENTNFGFLLADLNKNDYFYDTYAYRTLFQAETLFWLWSEDNIKNMGCLEWQVSAYYRPGSNEATDFGSYQSEAPPIDGYDFISEYDLVSKNRASQLGYGSVQTNDLNSIEAKQVVDNAIQMQLEQFYNAKNWLDGMPGLSYFVTDGERWYGNVPPDTDAEFYRQKPVYYISDYKIYEKSRNSDDSRDYPINLYQNLSISIAFSDEAVNWQNNIWKSEQHDFETTLALLTLPLVLALALIIILMVGAGRKYHSDIGGIHFMGIDKPWLDISLCVLVGYEAALGYILYVALDTAWQYNNTKWMTILFAIASAALMLPALWWLLCFTKRCKSGKFWRHTMCFVLIRWIFREARRLLKSIWAGTRMTTRIVIIGIAEFVGLLICLGSVWYRSPLVLLLLSFAISAATVLLLLRYARKIHILEQGAKAVSGGSYGEPIAVTGGELGNIAASINNISDGINVAVMERLKSERLKTELISNISHDIRTPLTSLITYTDLLKNEGLDNIKAPEYLEILIQKSARLKTLIDDLFEASKAASGNIEAHVENLDLVDFIRQVLGELDERVRGSGLDFRLNLPEHSLVRADGRLLWRVMENLLSNVFKYALEGSRVYIDVVPDNGSYRMDIKNVSSHPLNVDPSELTERFKRGDESRSGDGSGLGLSIAQSFVAAQGGRFALTIDGDLFKASLYLPMS